MKSTIALRQPVWLCNEIDPKVSCNRELDPRMQNETKPAFFVKSFVETKFSESRRTELNWTESRRTELNWIHFSAIGRIWFPLLMPGDYKWRIINTFQYKLKIIFSSFHVKADCVFFTNVNPSPASLFVIGDLLGCVIGGPLADKWEKIFYFVDLKFLYSFCLKANLVWLTFAYLKHY